MSRCSTFVVLLVLLSGGRLAAAEPKPAPETPEQRCRVLCHETACEHYEFYGFAPDSGRFGYAHLTCPGALEKEEPRFTWHVRHIHTGKRKLPTSGVVLQDVSYPGYFRQVDYRLHELPRKAVGKNAYEFAGPGTTRLVVAMQTEEKVSWYFTLYDGDKRIGEYKGTFEEIYFGLVPRVWVSPNGQRAAVVLTLDAMVRVDGALVIFNLNP